MTVTNSIHKWGLSGLDQVERCHIVALHLTATNSTHKWGLSAPRLRLVSGQSGHLAVADSANSEEESWCTMTSPAHKCHLYHTVLSSKERSPSRLAISVSMNSMEKSHPPIPYATPLMMLGSIAHCLILVTTFCLFAVKVPRTTMTPDSAMHPSGPAHSSMIVPVDQAASVMQLSHPLHPSH